MNKRPRRSHEENVKEPNDDTRKTEELYKNYCKEHAKNMQRTCHVCACGYPCVGHTIAPPTLQ